MKKFKRLSIVSPAFNEEANLAELIPEMTAVLPGLLARCGQVEWIVADDGSTDHTAELLDSGPDWIRRLPLKHRGMSAALFDGVMAARGDVIATLDADCQSDPAGLPRMLEVLAVQEADMVCGVRTPRRDPLVKRLSSRLANRVRNIALSDSIQDSGCTLRVFMSTARPLCFWPVHGGHRFVASFAQLQGLKVVQVEVNHRPRRHGQSHFGVSNRLPKVLWDLFGAKWLMARAFRPQALPMDDKPERPPS